MRSLHLTGMPNARDLGGVVTADGKTVRRGRLIRSGALTKLTEKDILTLQDIPLKTVVDFRSDREISEKPDLIIPGVRQIHCPILPELTGVTRELGDDGIPAYFRMAMDIGMEADSFMAGLYVPLAESEYSQKHYKQFFLILLEQDDGAVLYHCTIGKDRVGVGTMLLLSALGVDFDTIMADYLLTNDYTVASRAAACEEAMQYSDDPATRFAMQAFESVRPAYLLSALHVIEEQYGSMDQYLREVLEIGPSERKALCEKYLE